MPSPQASPASPNVRFGAFEVDLRAGELRKNGARIRLQEQPFQILASLLEHPGEIVTRDELRQKLWPGGTFVDFDHSLNTAVNKIREALNDSASNPHYVETVARRGYRFVAAVDPQSFTVPQAAAGLQPAHASETPSLHPELDIPLPHRAIPRILFAMIQVMYVVFYLEALFRWRGADAAISSFLPSATADAVLMAMFVTSAIGIVFRCYFLSAIGFDYRFLRRNFERIFIAVLILDEFWAMAPFLAAGRIGFGLAFAAVAALLYVPFAERTLLQMAYLNP
jgi:DNA-binding winged helix-turn-helix (wHTH) protein